MSKVSDGVKSLPAPPPPPLPNLSVISTANSSETNAIDDSEETVHANIINLYKNIVTNINAVPSKFKYTHLKPLIQDGPTCGLVALSMISSLASRMYSANELLELARHRGFTKKGEMFSAFNMASLASEVLNDSFEIRHYRGGIQQHLEEVIENLLFGNVYMIPYDADKNHSPANLNGLKAHWAILCGVLSDSHHTFLMGKQSKSRHVALWDVESLHHSNMNLTEIAVSKADANDYIIDDIKCTLAGNYILFMKK